MVNTSAGGGGSGSANASSRGSPAVMATSHQPSRMGRMGHNPTNGNHQGNPQLPLSCMKPAPPLDLLTVERKGQPTAIREPVKKKSRPHDLKEAPTYFPTEEEFKDPFAFIKKISDEARQYGLCKIVPPDSWNPDFAINTEKFFFRTRKQELNSVEGSSRANFSYIDALQKFHKQNGNGLVRLPFVDKKPLDLYRLKKAVEARGGFDKVCKLKKWAEIGRDLGYSGKIMSSLSTSLKNSYQRWLCPYEDYLKLVKPGVQQQLEAEFGGPFTPSPAATPMKRSNVNTPSSMRADSPARHATDALQASINGFKEGDRDTPMAEATTLQPPPAGGFTAINNSSGFTAVNSGFTSVNRTPLNEGQTPPSKGFGSPLSSAKNTPEFRPSGLGAATSLKRQLSTDSVDSKKDIITDKDEADGGSRRSKRLKKDTVPTVAGSHMSLFRPTGPRLPRDESALPGEQCEQCGKAEEAGALIVCESCDLAYHETCLEPPPKQKPDTEWNCPRCLVGDNQFGFEEGGLYSLRQFQQKANDFKQAYFEKRMPVDAVHGGYRPVTEEDVEKEFWRLVADLEDTVEVEYGADIHCTTHGSGFPTIEKNPLNTYSLDPWNLNLLPLHPDSLFRHIKSDISGMTVPWVYVGMIFSTFCWHNEDHYSYSANYQHFGATKTWYGIPGEDAEKFEQAMREAVPELFEAQPDLLFQLVTLLTPEQLTKAGVRVYALDQRAGQFVITFPQAYHAGFNHGFNFNEAVNFAPSDWEPFGLAGVECLQQFRRQPCFSHDELLYTAAEGTPNFGLSIQTARWLQPALDRIHDREAALRKNFATKHLEASPHKCSFSKDEEPTCPLIISVDDVDVPEEEYQCAYCKAFAYLSRFKCLKSNKVLCLHHAGVIACCDSSEQDRFLGDEHVLCYRKSEDMLEATSQKVAEKAYTPEAWEEKLKKFLEGEITPPLKMMRNLLHEGERIPFELPSLPTLREFVERCNDWVEEATNYTVRKQQIRRKNEKPWQSGSRKSIGSSQDKDARNVSNISRLLQEAEHIGFDCPEILQLRERADAIEHFQQNAARVLKSHQVQNEGDVEELLEEGRSFNVEMPEIDKLSRMLDQQRWNTKAKASRGELMSLNEVSDLIEEGKSLDIPAYNDHLSYYMEQMANGLAWEKKAKELISAEVTHFPQLAALSTQVTANNLPVSQETLAAVDQILHKQREAHRQIMDLIQRSHSNDFRERPHYQEVAELMKKLEDLNSKPSGTMELEKEQKRHEDWMRKGKKLFGKTNAPLHILKSHMEYVLDRNLDCFDMVNDKPRSPVEPASHEASPEPTSNEGGKLHRWEDPRFREVFCICRKIEAGMMIECELCHEWYHGKCLKIARGKVKDEDKYTCPICDWRVKIPRDATRPKLEDLVAWQEEIPDLPFQPEEEEVLKKIIDNAQKFRDHITPYCNPVLSTKAEAETQRFYLRKIEGAEILLSYETNFFKQELHKWFPVAPEPPPVTDQSKSTRKPRPTKLQKMLAQYGVEDFDDLPETVKGKANSLRRKQMNAELAAAAAAMQSGPSQAGSPPAGASGRIPSYFSSQPPSAGLPTSSHGAPGSDGRGSRGSDASIKGEMMDLDRPGIHPMFMNDGSGGPQLTVSESALSLEDKLLRGDEDLNLDSEASKREALDVLQRTEQGRRKAEEIFGPDVWSKQNGSTERNANDALRPREDDGEVDKMFMDLTEIADDEDTKKKDEAATVVSSDATADSAVKDGSEDERKASEVSPDKE